MTQRRPTNTTTRREAQAKAARKRALTRSLRAEQLEERIVMDAYTGVEGNYGNVWFTAKGDDAKWVGPDSKAVPSTYTTTSPVEISLLEMGAPDGASVTRFQPSGDSLLGATLTPTNGLLTIENGQKVIRYTNGTRTIDNAQQQEITLGQDLFPANIVADAGSHSKTEYKTNFTVPTTGQYNFYISHFGSGDVSIANNNAQWSSRTDPTKLTTQLTAGSLNSFVLNYDHSGYHDSGQFLKVEWDGPGMPRQSFVPNSDIVYRHNFGFGRSERELKGFISPQAYFSADKRLRDNNFALRYKTTFTIPTTGEYTFYLASDNRAELKIGNDAVIRKEVVDASAKRTYTAGTILNLELNYLHTSGAHSLKFEWSGPGLTRQLFKSPSLVSYEYFEGDIFFVDDLKNAVPKLTGSSFDNPKLFVIEWDGQRTIPIEVGASAETVRKAIEALSNVGAVGGSVTVTRATNGLKYNVTFGGNTWFRPPLMKIVARPGALVRPITTVAVTKRDSNANLTVQNLARPFSVKLSNPNTFPIDNAPMFTPEILSNININQDLNRNKLSLVMSGYLQSPAVGGRFDPDYSNTRSDREYNVVRTDTGLRVVRRQENFGELLYRLNAVKDSAGNSRPLTLFTLGGLQFEAVAGSQAKLLFENSDNKLIFESTESSLLVSAPFEGGKLNLRLVREDRPIYRVDLQTGKVDITPKFEFVSFEIGGFVIPPSESFKMTYDAAAQKFSFAINNLVVESPHPEGTPKAYEFNDDYKNVVQTFEPGYRITNASYSYAMGNWGSSTAETFRNNALPRFGKTGPQLGGELLSIPQEAWRNGYADYFGAVYKWTLNVSKTGLYTFRSMGYGLQELRINNTIVLSGTTGQEEKTFQLSAGVDYSFDYLHINRGSLTGTFFLILFSGPSTGGLNVLYPTAIGEINGISSADLNSRTYLYNPSLEYLKNVLANAIDRQDGLTEAQRKQIKTDARVTVEPTRVTITNIPYLLKITGQWSTTTAHRFSNPVKLTIPRGTFSITKGNLDPITDLPVDSFEVGATTLTDANKFGTTYEPIKPSQAGGFKATFFQRNTYNSDGSVNIPGNTFGVYGNQSKLPLDVAGVKLDGLANLGSATAPGLIVTNGQFIKLSYPIPEVTVDGMVFTATSVGSARPLSVNYYPPAGSDRKSYVVQGGAVLKPGGTLIKTDLKANFGGLGSDGLRIYPANRGAAATYTLSFGVVGAFLAGTQAIESVQGSNGLKLLYDPVKKEYRFNGDAILDFNPVTPHTPTNMAFTGSRLEVSATIPDGVTGLQPNLLNGSTLNFYLSERASINGFQIAPRPTANPLRVTITSASDTIGGSFTMRLANSFLYGVMERTNFNGAKAPAGGFALDFSPVAGQPFVFSLAGVQLSDSRKTILTDTLILKFEKAAFQGRDLVAGTAGAEPGIIEAKNGKITRGEITRSTPIQLGDIAFNSFKATYIGSAAAVYWSFKGPGKYFNKNVEVGTPGVGNPQVKIGGDPTKGFQLNTTNEPVPAITPDFKLPETIDVAGLTFDTSLLPQDEPVVDEGPQGKTFSLKSNDYKIKLGNTVLSLSLKVKVKVSTAGVDIVSFSATGVQNSEFTIGNAKFQVQTLTVEYKLADKSLNISGKAKFSFKAAKANVEMTVTLGTSKDPGLVIADGAVQSLKVAVDGTFDLLKLTVAAETLTVAYQKENNEFAIYGGVKISTAVQGGIQVIKDLAVTLGSEDKPGIKIVDGSLQALDITINGEINLFKLTATPKDLHIAYSAEDNQLQIDGALSVTLAPKLTITAGLPGDGLLIDTDTGKVQVKGLSLQAEGNVTFGAMTIKGLHIDYEEAENGDVTIGAGAEIQLPSGLAVGGSFKIVNGKLDSIGIIFEKNPGILVANGVVNIYRLDVLVEGLSDLDNFKFKGTIKASVGPLVKFAGQSYALADVTGSVEITTRYLKLSGDVELVGGELGQGFFEGTLLWNPTAGDANQLPRVTFEAEVKLFPGDVVRGTIKAYADIRGNVDFNANMGVFVPAGIPLAGGSSMGQLLVELRVRPALEPSASYVKFGFSDIAITAVRIPTFHGNIRVGFDSKVDYGFGARFHIPLPWPLPDIDFSLGFNGSFQLRDSQRPFIEILAAAALDGTPDGEILFSATTPIPDGTIIDLYADRDNQGNDGLLIASNLAYHQGTQRYVWDYMAAFASPGQPIYVYAVINDQRHATEFSNYSAPFNVAPGFVPTILSPASVKFTAGQPVTFAEAFSNKIVIGDPRANSKPESEVEVVLSAGGGTIDLSHAPDSVRYSGAGTSQLTLRGTAASITDALDGVYYAQRVASDNTDRLEISVLSLPLLNQSGKIKTHVELIPNAVGLSLVAATDIDAPTTVTVGSDEELPLALLQIDTLHSEQVIGAKVEIVGYEPGKDILSLALSDEILSGLESTFDASTGVLTLSGFDWTEDFQFALQNVAFITSSLTVGKSLKVSLSDDNGEIGDLIVPLSIVPGHTAPTLELTSLGTTYTPASGSIRLDAESNLDVADGSQLQTIQVSFIEDSYVPGEDTLNYVGTAIGGTFDAESGTLLLTGTGTEAEWLHALHNIRYQSIGSTFTEGSRYLEITITDDGAENNSDSSLFVIRKATSLSEGSQISVDLHSLSINLPPHEDYVTIAEGISVVAEDSLILGATVAITHNYIPGEDELQVTSIWDGMDAEFDTQTGVLTITGVATAFEYEDVLRSIIFVDAAGYRTPGDIEISFTLFDGLSTIESDMLILSIQSAPFVVGAIDNVLNYEQGRELEMIGASIDIDFDSTITSATISFDDGFQADQDELTFVNQGTIHGAFDSASGVLTLTGQATVEQYEAALASVGYRNSRYNPVAGNRIVTFQVSGQSAVSNAVPVLISVEPDVVPPQVAIGPTSAFQENGSPVAIAPDLSIVPMDATNPFLSAPEELYGAEIDIVNYVPGEDVLRFVATDNISGAFDLDEGRLTLFGEASFDEYETVLQSVVYSNTSDVPNTTTRQIRIRLLDSGAGGMANQAFTSQVVIGVVDVVDLAAGTADDIQLLQNDAPASLGLDDLVFNTPSLGDISAGFVELKFIVSQLPADTLGRVVTADGTELELNKPYAIDALTGLRFEPTFGGAGVTEFAYSVVVADADSGNYEASGFSDTVSIVVEGAVTNSPLEAYLAQAYRDLFDRNVDPATMATLASALEDKLELVDRSRGFATESAARSSLLLELFDSEAVRRTQVNSLYQSLLGRLPTADELATRSDALAGSLTLDDLKLEVIASSEYFEMHNETGYSSYVDAVYEALLQREPSGAERASAVASLQNGQPLASVVVTIGHWSKLSESDQRKLISDLLDREYDFDDQFLFDFSSRETLTLSIISSDEYFQRSATPITTDFTPTQVTHAYSAVGILGDIGGGKASGTLIAPQVILVAAHSVIGIPQGQLTFEIGGVVHRIAQVIIHPEFNTELIGSDGGNDIALLKLDAAVTEIEPAQLTGRSPRLGEALKLVGFGEDDGDRFGTKRVGSTPLVDQVERTVFRWTQTSPDQNDSDPGDSGSPLFVSDNGPDRIVGIVMGGTAQAGGVGSVGTNTRIDAYLDWIRSIVPSIAVSDVNDPPTMQIEDSTLFLDENSGPHSLAFEVSAHGAVSFTIDTDNSGLFSRLSIDYGGFGFGEIDFETAVNARGTAKIVVTAIAGSLSSTHTITLTVEQRNDPPYMNDIETQVIDVNAGPQSILLSGLSAGTGETGNVLASIAQVIPNDFFTSIGIEAPSSGTGLSAQSTIDKVLKYRVRDGATGWGYISIQLRDAGPDEQFNTADDETVLEQLAVRATANKAPTLAAINPQQFLLDAGQQSIELTGIGDGGDRSQELRIDLLSSDMEVANVYVLYDGESQPSTADLIIVPTKIGSTVVLVQVTDPGDDGVFESEDDRVTTRSMNLTITDSINYWHNFAEPLDVNNDSVVTPLDLLLVINHINAATTRELTGRSSPAAPYLDTDNNGLCTALDALQIVNRLNAHQALLSVSSGEADQTQIGESISPPARSTQHDLALFDLFANDNESWNDNRDPSRPRRNGLTRR